MPYAREKIRILSGIGLIPWTRGGGGGGVGSRNFFRTYKNVSAHIIIFP